MNDLLIFVIFLEPSSCFGVLEFKWSSKPPEIDKIILHTF